jgi:hypothetical protein
MSQRLQPQSAIMRLCAALPATKDCNQEKKKKKNFAGSEITPHINQEKGATLVPGTKTVKLLLFPDDIQSGI